MSRGKAPNDPGFEWVGESLRVRRAAAHLSQEELAGEVGVARSTIQRWESERGNAPTKGDVRALACALGCRPSDFSREARVA